MAMPQVSLTPLWGRFAYGGGPLFVPRRVARRPARAAGDGIDLVDSAENCALAVKALLGAEVAAAPAERLGKLDVALTDSTESFLRTAERALELEIGDVQLRTVQAE